MSASRTTVLASICVLLPACGLSAQGQTGGEPAAGVEYDWRSAAGEVGLSADQIEALAENKVLMTQAAYRQIFSPYVGGSLPVFITSDSLLNAFHVLYEESVLRLESANVPRLRAALRHIWDGLTELEPGVDESQGERWKRNRAFHEKVSEESRPLVAQSLRRAEAIIGTALRLMGEPARGCGAEAAKLIEAERARVLEAAVRLRPVWPGDAEPAFVELDYNRCKPRGFYERSERLKGYFRAVSWLQSIPMRIRRDAELMTALLIGRTLEPVRFDWNDAAEDRLLGVFRVFRRFLGRPDDWDAPRAAQAANRHIGSRIDKAALADIRRALAEEARCSGAGARVNDLVRLPPNDPDRVDEIGFRVLSACRAPDAMLFQRTTDIRRFERRLPNGLEVAILLGSDAGRRLLEDPQRGKVLAVIDDSKGLFYWSGLYGQYLRCLAALLDAPEPDAPAFMKSDAWQRKSLQTVLSGWAQLRHTWILQAKQNVTWFGATNQPAGFVEPEPEFFGRLAELAEDTEAELREAGAFEGAAFAEPLLERIAALEKAAAASRPATAEARSPGEATSRPDGGDPWIELRAFSSESFELARLKALLADVEAGRPIRETALRLLADEGWYDVAGRWRKFSRLCRALQSLAHRQLRGVPLNKQETGFIKSYGGNLADIMFYEGNSYLSPDDDAMRIADIVHDPALGRTLHVGVARPRALFVLYPRMDREVLCRGAVMPYYEFTHPTRLTDGEWRKMLAAPDPPKPPAWLDPLGAHAAPTARTGKADKR